ncbi:hypothetical protein [Streptomyces mirabilis]|uniref:hypothetical protein n=1 Tax=Streptomyces mirabilis TaxID=68239 RepID=UPI0036DD7B4A
MEQLTRLLLQRHAGEQVLDALVDGAVRIAVRGGGLPWGHPGFLASFLLEAAV